MKYNEVPRKEFVTSGGTLNLSDRQIRFIEDFYSVGPNYSEKTERYVEDFVVSCLMGGVDTQELLDFIEKRWPIYFDPKGETDLVIIEDDK